MSRLTERNEEGKAITETLDFHPLIDKLAHYEDLEEDGRLIDTKHAAMILAETFGYEHPCNFNGIDEWFPEVCNLGETCPDGKLAVTSCWEQYIKIKLAELKGGAE